MMEEKEVRSGRDYVSANADLNLSQELVTKLTKHETSDLYGLRTFIDTTHVGGQSMGTRTGTQSAKPPPKAAKRAVNIRYPNTSRKAKTLWRVREA